MPISNVPEAGVPEPMGHSQLGGSVNLGFLVGNIISKTYHQLTILAEICAAKSDTQKKLEIIIFVKQTRKSFVRLIALVKWASGVSKINKCSEILDYLDQQSLYFTGRISNHGSNPE